MADHQLPKLNMRVRFPSSAPERLTSQANFNALFGDGSGRLPSLRAPHGPQRSISLRRTFALQAFPSTTTMGLDTPVERFGDRAVSDLAAVLVDQGGRGES